MGPVCHPPASSALLIVSSEKSRWMGSALWPEAASYCTTSACEHAATAKAGSSSGVGRAARRRQLILAIGCLTVNQYAVYDLKVAR